MYQDPTAEIAALRVELALRDAMIAKVWDVVKDVENGCPCSCGRNGVHLTELLQALTGFGDEEAGRLTLEARTPTKKTATYTRAVECPKRLSRTKSPSLVVKGCGCDPIDDDPRTGRCQHESEAKPWSIGSKPAWSLSSD